MRSMITSMALTNCIILGHWMISKSCDLSYESRAMREDQSS